ncbi:DUF4238 domain-containing protein [Spirosoma gilvum]
MKDFDSDFLPKKPSKKHHYLPIFYLNGFTDEKGLFYVYDKLEKKFHVRQRPDNWFCVNHLNSYRPDGKFLFTLEEPYHTEMDSQSAPFLRKIKDGDGTQQIDMQDKIQIILFFSMLFWWSPYSDELFRKLVETEGLSSRHFNYITDDSGNPLPDSVITKIQHEILSNVDNLRYFKQTVPLSPSALQEGIELLEKWNLFYLPNSFEDTLIGDSPFITNNPELRLDRIFNELIVPISKNRILILADKVPEFYDGHLHTLINTSILHQSNRYVACANEAFLRHMVEGYEGLKPEFLNVDLNKVTYDIMHRLNQ